MTEEKKKELLFSVTHKDFELEFFTAGGPGGQHRNRVKTACRIRHKNSGAVATATEHKSQSQNKEAAFLRLTKTKTFENWLRLECSRRLLEYKSIQEMIECIVSKQMDVRNLKFEVQDEKGRWVEVDFRSLDLVGEINENIS